MAITNRPTSITEIKQRSVADATRFNDINKIDELADVEITAIGSGDSLVWDGNKWVNTPPVPVVPPKGNALINGAFDFWKRGTSFSNLGGDAAPTNAYFADKFQHVKSGNMRFNFNRSTDVPSGSLHPYSANATAVASIPTQYVTNSTFDTNISGWFIISGATHFGAWASPGVLQTFNGPPLASQGGATVVSGLTIGQSYTASLTYEFPIGNGNSRPISLRHDTLGNLATTTGQGPGTLSANFVASATSHTLGFHYDSNTAAYVRVDNFSITRNPPLADSYSYFEQLVEGNIAKFFYSKTLYLSFWVKSTKVGTNCVRLTNGAQNRNYIMEYTVDVANTWEQKTLTLIHDSTGTWPIDQSTGMRLQFILSSFAPYNTGTALAWSASTALSTSAQVNNGVNGDDFKITQIKLSDESGVFNYCGDTIQEEHQLCQRYYSSADELITLT